MSVTMSLPTLPKDFLATQIIVSKNIILDIISVKLCHSKNCAWCTEKGFQCDKKNKDTGVDAKEGSRCTNGDKKNNFLSFFLKSHYSIAGKNKNYCKNQQGD